MRYNPSWFVSPVHEALLFVATVVSMLHIVEASHRWCQPPSQNGHTVCRSTRAIGMKKNLGSVAAD